MLLSLEPHQQSEDPDEAPTILTQRVNASSPRDATRPSLPDRIRSSPEVVAELSSRGVDFLAGPSDMKLESRISSAGDAVWVTYYFDEEFTARLAADGS